MYEPKFTADFEKDFERVATRDPVYSNRILNVVERILQAPHNNDGWLHGLLSGKRKKYVGRAGHRIVFAICGECRKLGHKKLNGCTFCSQTTDNTVVFFRIFPKKERHDDYNP